MPGRADLLEILRRAQTQGFLGPGDPADHLNHALGFADAALAQLGGPPARFADLGTGGGVPGLVLAVSWPEAGAAFVESSARRCAALAEWLADLDLTERVRILEGRAEVWAHAPEVRESFDLVTARSFARPAVTAEIAAGLVVVGGLLLVSEPPVTTEEERWPQAALADLGFDPAVPVVARDAHYVGLRKARPAAEKVPRGVGKPGKRPLW